MSCLAVPAVSGTACDTSETLGWNYFPFLLAFCFSFSSGPAFPFPCSGPLVYDGVLSLSLDPPALPRGLPRPSSMSIPHSGPASSQDSTRTPLSSLLRLGLPLPGGAQWALRSTSSAASGRCACPPGPSAEVRGHLGSEAVEADARVPGALMATVVLPTIPEDLLPHHLVTLAHRSCRGLGLAPRGTFGKDHRCFCHHEGGATGISGWRLERPVLVLRHRTGSSRRQQC